MEDWKHDTSRRALFIQSALVFTPTLTKMHINSRAAPHRGKTLDWSGSEDTLLAWAPDTGLGNGFLNETPKGKKRKKKMDKFDFIKILKICTLNDIIKKVKRQHLEFI